MATVRYFWHGFIHRGTTCRKPSARPSLLMFGIDRPIARISSSLVLYRLPRNGSCRSDRNRMDSYRVSTVDVPESPIASGARRPWQQQWCDSLHFHEKWWGSVPPSVVVFACVHAITISSPKWRTHCEGPGTTQELNLSLLWCCQYRTSTKVDALIVYDAFQTLAKGDK